jgi:hypothetical protein
MIIRLPRPGAPILNGNRPGIVPGQPQLPSFLGWGVSF